nr:high mobility group B protein 7 [Tanacetum cinerariifolium]
MAYQTRSRKRVNALRRGPDGSAFQTCENCGVLVAVALVDMHECECELKKVGVKKAKGEKVEMHVWDDKRFKDQPRSEFRFFMESFMKDSNSQNFFEMDREGFETWKNMSSEEKLSYKLKAKKVDDDHNEKLLKESEDQMYSYVDEEADSAEVGKFDKNIGSYEKDTYDSDYDSDHDGSLYHQAKHDRLATSEYERYVKIDFVSHLSTEELAGYDVLGFWKANESTFTVISQMARDILSVQATSIASESAFSTSGRVLSIRRTRLTPASLEMCMCLKDHMDAAERVQHISNLENSLDFEA